MRKTSVDVHTARLKRLVRILKGVGVGRHKGKFNMGDFGSHYDGHRPAERNYCGTSACALGWAALDKRFNAEGLKGTWIFDGTTLRITCHGKSFIDAGKHFFGLTDGEAANLFGGELVRRATVLREIERLIKHRAECRPASS